MRCAPRPRRPRTTPTPESQCHSAQAGLLLLTRSGPAVSRLLGLGEAALSTSLGGAKQGERLRAPLCSIVLASLVDWLVAQVAAAPCA